MLLVRLTARDIWGFTLNIMLSLLQLYSDVKQIYVDETRHRDTYEDIFIFMFCYLEPIQIAVQLWHDWNIFDKVAQHHISGFIMLPEVLRTIKLTLFVRGPEP